jgi:hypothetical protein
MSDYNRERASERTSERERETPVDKVPPFTLAASCDLLYSTLLSRINV